MTNLTATHLAILTATGTDDRHLSDVRKAAGLDRSTFDAALKDLRFARMLTCEASDGRHDRANAEQLEAGIDEGDQVLVYVRRRAA